MAEGARFFVVDDDPFMVRLLTKLLESAGHLVSSTTSSVEAVESIRSEKPDLVLTDIMMPEVDGIELCRRLREIPELAGMKILVVTSQSYESYREKAEAAGADGYLQKPVYRDKLLQVIEETLGRPGA